jgi:hypothetical protein
VVKRFGLAMLALSVWGSAAHAIVGGAEEAGPLARSSLMVLSSKGGVCSAVVVAPDVVLTAAHCVTDADEHRVHFRDETGEPVLIAPAAKIVHPGFNPRAVEERRRSIDLALIRVPAPLPARFTQAALSGAVPTRDSTLVVGGYGVVREGDGKSTGTFRTTRLKVTEPFGPSAVLVWLEGAVAGACQGDSGGPISLGTSVSAITTWAKGTGRSSCGRTTQGILLGPQREWIDRTLAVWGRTAHWDQP